MGCDPQERADRLPGQRDSSLALEGAANPIRAADVVW
jgi:hypothetical protein